MGLAPQLEHIDRQLTDARRRAHDVATRVGPERWRTRPATGEWSVAECVVHLNLTSQAFLPAAIDPPAKVLQTFDALQEQVRGCVHEAQGLDLGRIRLASPFDARLKYNLYSCLRIIPAHQRQHLVQAENVIESLRKGAGRG